MNYKIKQHTFNDFGYNQSNIISSHSKHQWCHQRAVSAIRQAPLTLCPAMLTGRSVLLEERKKKNGGEKMNKCRGMLWKQRGLQNRVTCSCKIRGSRSHCTDLHNRALHIAGSEIGLYWNHSPIYHTGGPPVA